MCIRDRVPSDSRLIQGEAWIDYSFVTGESRAVQVKAGDICLLYTSDAADERSSVDLGGRRIIKKKTDNRRYQTGIVKKITTRRWSSRQISTEDDKRKEES